MMGDGRRRERLPALQPGVSDGAVLPLSRVVVLEHRGRQTLNRDMPESGDEVLTHDRRVGTSRPFGATTRHEVVTQPPDEELPDGCLFGFDVAARIESTEHFSPLALGFLLRAANA